MSTQTLWYISGWRPLWMWQKAILTHDEDIFEIGSFSTDAFLNETKCQCQAGPNPHWSLIPCNPRLLSCRCPINNLRLQLMVRCRQSHLNLNKWQHQPNCCRFRANAVATHEEHAELSINLDHPPLFSCFFYI